MEKPKVEVGRWDERDPGRAAGRKTSLGHLEALAWLLDSSIPLPGTRFRIGIESLIGLVPVIGDAVGALLSAYILFASARLGIPRVTLMRMGFNVFLDTALGMVPIAGDIFDFAWKANIRNVDLLRAHLEDPARARRGDWAFAAAFILLLIGTLFLMGWGAVSIGWIIGGFFAG